MTSLDDLEVRLRATEDRLAIQDVLYRYASTIDRRDLIGLRTTVDDEFRGKYGDGDWVEGGDQIVSWIDAMTSGTVWQHHLLSVYHVDIDGDRATALTYHTSHQTTPDAPNTPKVIIARYHDELVRRPTGWKISSKVMEILWRGVRGAPDEIALP
jgi:hypothetical protein